MLKSSLRKFTVATMTWLSVTEYLYHKWPRMCSVCRNHNSVLSSFMIYHRVSNYSKTKSGICGAATTYSLGAPELTSDFRGVRVARSLVFCVMFCGSLFVPLSVFFWPLSCLSFDLWLLITSLVSSNFSYNIYVKILHSWLDGVFGYDNKRSGPMTVVESNKMLELLLRWTISI